MYYAERATRQYIERVNGGLKTPAAVLPCDSCYSAKCGSVIVSVNMGTSAVPGIRNLRNTLEVRRSLAQYVGLSNHIFFYEVVSATGCVPQYTNHKRFRMLFKRMKLLAMMGSRPAW